MTETVTYQTAKAELDAYNERLRELDIPCAVVIQHEGTLASVVAVFDNGARHTIGEGLTARGVVGTLKLARRILDHVYGTDGADGTDTNDD